MASHAPLTPSLDLATAEFPFCNLTGLTNQLASDMQAMIKNLLSDHTLTFFQSKQVVPIDFLNPAEAVCH